ncbi:MAG: heavy-metal-associated domain-containing protein [Clostridia bacterium]|nr:heavy-metal-associated domain-containing protein [Clostridia bacterium]
MQYIATFDIGTTAVKGVLEVEVSLENKTATVTAPASVSVEALKEAVTKAGYEVK